MRFRRFFVITVIITLVTLVYIHMQMQIIELAYEGKQKQSQITRLSELNEDYNSKILTLKSANNIGERIMTEKSDMNYAAPENVLEFSALSQGITAEGLNETPAAARGVENSFHNLLTFVSRTRP